MPAIVLENFANGIDRRGKRHATPEGMLWNVRNAYINKAKRLAVRWGIGRTHPTLGMTACEGWWRASNGVLFTAAIIGTAFNANGQATVLTLDPSGTGNTVIKRVLMIAPFAAFFYIVVEYGDGSIAHHYTDNLAPGTRITDPNCPNSRSITVAGNRVFGPTLTGIVRYCALGAPRDWSSGTAAIGAGFLAASSNMADAGNPTAVGQFQQDVAVFFRNAAQLWFPDVVKENMFLRQRIYNTGTPSELSIVPFADDLAFVSLQGIRTVSIAKQTTNRFEGDIGVTIDDLPIGNAEVTGTEHYLLKPRVGGVNGHADQPVSAYCSELGQLWVAFPRINSSQTLLPNTGVAGATETAICVLTYSRSGSITGWTLFHVPYVIRDLKEDTGAGFIAPVMRALVQTSSTPPHNPFFVELSEARLFDTITNNTTRPISGEIMLPFLDNEQPGIMKQFSTLDLTATGTFNVSAAFNPNTPEVETVPIPIAAVATTEPDGLIPFEVSTVSLSPVLRFSQDVGVAEQSQLIKLQFFYESLGPL